MQDLLSQFGASPEYTNTIAGLSNTQIVTKIYQNVLGRAPDSTGLNFWVNALNNGYSTPADVAYDILQAALHPVDGVPNSDTAIVENKIAVAQAFTDALNTPEEDTAFTNSFANGTINDVRAWLASVNDDPASVDAAKAGLDSLVQKMVDADKPVDPGGDTDTIYIGSPDKDPTIAGNDKDNHFVAQTGDLHDNVILDGKGGYDTLSVTMRGDDAIAATTKNIEKVVVRVQDGFTVVGPDNNIVDGATVDADRMSGVKWWESNNSRSDLKIEDVRIQNNEITKDITIAFRNSDPGHVDYAVYFDQSSLRNQTSSSGSLNIAVLDVVGLEEDGLLLRDNPYNVVRFKIDGDLKEVNFARVDGASTPQDLANAISAAIAATPSLAAYNIQVTLTENATFWLPNDTISTRADAGYFITLSASNHTIEGGGAGSWDAIGGLPQDNAVMARQVAANTIATDLVTSTVILDYVGRGSMGGDLVIGGLSTGYTSQSKGVEQFDITVERDSRLEVISSTNNTLKVVNLKNEAGYKYQYLGAYERLSNQGERVGDLTVKGTTSYFDGLNVINMPTLFGKAMPQLADPSAHANQMIDGAGPQQFNGYGFTDVRVVNGAAFQGNLDLNAFLSRNVVAKYMNLKDAAPAAAGADNTLIPFNYSLGAGDDKLDLAISSANLQAAGTTTREDFFLNISGGAGNDTITVAIANDDGVNANNPILEAAATDATPWYLNSKTNANLAIDAGAGDDTVNILGSGDWTVKLGAGNDTVYVGDTANKANSSGFTLAPAAGQLTAAGVSDKAVWVFNTADQAGALAGARDLADLTSGANNNRIVVQDGTNLAGGANGMQPGEMSGLYGLKLRVVYNDVSHSSHVDPVNDQGTFISGPISVPTTTPNSYIVTDLQINQAIKAAINGDPVLSKLLVATDGPSNTLVVTSLTDGEHVNVADLGIEFAIPTTTLSTAEISGWNAALTALNTSQATVNWNAADLAAGRVASLADLLGGAPAVSVYNDFGKPADFGLPTTVTYTDWQTGAATGDYASAFANDGANDFVGTTSQHTADNIIIVDGSTGDLDVVVLSTGALSNDTIKWNGSFNNGTVKVVNFDTNAAGLGDDWLDFTAYNARALFVQTLTQTAGAKNDGWTAANWVTSQDVIGLHSNTAGIVSATLPAIVDPNVVGDHNLKTGDKYITMTREPVPATSNIDATTLYKIELWTVVGNDVDAYTTTSLTPDTRQLIGYVDLGRVIEDSFDGNSIISHIDLF
ncbi:MAG: DUF4214 domain-containing protein [Azonexus sp.]|uniref:DUF4214 domain-containing protein n=1 Tax=Azonexus sp. TaxID=1872668 RepID=UPI0028261D91|nr:DUF4214 domain-containing protein [Azonexus sp.]MDR0775410.1 DUF4214 domain-containing protein [Azonexus sp.]